MAQPFVDGNPVDRSPVNSNCMHAEVTGILGLPFSVRWPTAIVDSPPSNTPM